MKALAVLFSAVFRFIIGKPNLPLEDSALASVLPKDADCVVQHLDDGVDDPGIEVWVQIRSGDASVKYQRIRRVAHVFETLDVFKKGACGFIAEFRNGEMRAMKRVAGFYYTPSELSGSQKNALYTFLDHVRELA